MKKVLSTMALILVLVSVATCFTACAQDHDLWVASDRIMNRALEDEDKLINKLIDAGYEDHTDELIVYYEAKYGFFSSMVPQKASNNPNVDKTYYFLKGEDEYGGDFVKLVHTTDAEYAKYLSNAYKNIAYGAATSGAYYYNEGDDAVGICGEWVYFVTTGALKTIK